MRFCLYRGEAIDDTLFEAMLRLDSVVFPIEQGNALPPEYFYELYAESKEGLFLLCDAEKGEVVAYLNAIFLNQEQRDRYLHGGHYRELKNCGLRKGGNILYLYTIACDARYRGGQVMKELAKGFVMWLDVCERQGAYMQEVFAEAVSEDGARILSKGFGMIPFDPEQIDEQGCGYYYAPDCLRQYRQKMKRIMQEETADQHC